MLALMFDALLPAPTSCGGVWLYPANVLLVPYWNEKDVSAPLGFTVPSNVALLVVIDEADPVTTVGACADCWALTAICPIALDCLLLASAMFNVTSTFCVTLARERLQLALAHITFPPDVHE
jgi:hypothetical protein